MSNENEMTYEKFMSEVDNCLLMVSGVSSEDLPDYMYHDAWEDGEDPSDVARSVLLNSGFEFEGEEE